MTMHLEIKKTPLLKADGFKKKRLNDFGLKAGTPLPCVTQAARKAETTSPTAL